MAEETLSLDMTHAGDAFLCGTVELRWLDPLWDHENLFETAVVRATEGYY